jgi:hypothetical protein
MLAVALNRHRPVSVRGTPEMVEAVREHVEAQAEMVFLPRAAEPAAPGDELVVIDGAEPLDVLAGTTESPCTLLVIRSGLPRTALQAMAAEFLEGELNGMILYHVGGRRRASHRLAARQPGAEVASSAAPTAKQDRVAAADDTATPSR